MTQNKAITKYLLYILILILGLILCGQLIAQLYTVRQLNKVNGKVIKTDVAVTSYTKGKRRSLSKPNYSFVITLNNGQFFDFDLNDKNWQIENILQKGDDITIYYPTATYDIFSLNILEFGSKGSQIEFGGKVLYRFTDQKNEAWPFTLLIAAAILVACYRLYGVYNGE
ncbi:MAG: hypothetical protein NVSMB24_16150 [Mucilaginibacter sp.]